MSKLLRVYFMFEVPRSKIIPTKRNDTMHKAEPKSKTSGNNCVQTSCCAGQFWPRAFQNGRLSYLANQWYLKTKLWRGWRTGTPVDTHPSCGGYWARPGELGAVECEGQGQGMTGQDEVMDVTEIMWDGKIMIIIPRMRDGKIMIIIPRMRNMMIENKPTVCCLKIIV